MKLPFIVLFFMASTLIVNAQSEITRNWDSFMQSIDVSFLKKKVKFKLTASVKVFTENERSHALLWARVDNKGGGTGFFDNMFERPIRVNEWKEYTIEGTLDEKASKLNIGALFFDNGKFYFDNFQLFIENESGELQKTQLNNPDFEQSFSGNSIPGWIEGIRETPVRVRGFSFSPTDDNVNGGHALAVEGKGILNISDNSARFVSYQQESFAITNVTLIDGKGTAPQSNMTVIVKGGKITEVGTSDKIAVPTEAQIIDAKGKTLIPGFVMLHEHIFYTKLFENEFNIVNMTNTFPRMYLAGGVTTMRTAGSVSPHADLNINRMIKEGKMIGPKMDVTGPFIERASTTSTPIPQMPIIPNEQQAGATIDYWADQGATSFKVYTHITKNDLKQVVKRAHARGFKVTGHLCSVTYNEASEIGIDNLEHGFMVSSDFVTDKQSELCDVFKQRTSLMNLNKDDEKMTNLMKSLIQRGVTVTATPAVYAPVTDYEMVLGGGEAALNADILKDLKTRYDRAVGRDSSQKKLFEKELYWEKKFYDMGGKLAIGTDPTGAGRAIAGYSNMWSLEILVKAGFTLQQAIMICTLKGAEYLKRDKEVGSIEKGKAADFILIDADLTSNVNNIRKIQWVFKDGIGYDSKTIFESVKGKVGLY